MKVGKPISKRQTVRLRHKIQKSSSAKQKKERKLAKKNPQWTSRLKKDPGIPKSFPFRDQVLAEVEETKRRKEEEQMRKREVAKARRQGISVAEEVGGAGMNEEGSEDEEMEMEMEGKVGNPMAALLASAQARAQDFGDEDEASSDEEEEAWNGINDTTKPSTQPAKKPLPAQALADPVKTISTLMDRMKETTDGIQRLIEYYQTPALATAGTDISTRFLVEVARKRGRLGRGGVPNLHSAAMLVLNDLNEERLKLPEVQKVKKSSVVGKGEITIVQTMAEPFRLEGLWGGKGAGEAMEVEVET